MELDEPNKVYKLSESERLAVPWPNGTVSVNDIDELIFSLPGIYNGLLEKLVSTDDFQGPRRTAQLQATKAEIAAFEDARESILRCISETSANEKLHEDIADFLAEPDTPT